MNKIYSVWLLGLGFLYANVEAQTPISTADIPKKLVYKRSLEPMKPAPKRQVTLFSSAFNLDEEGFLCRQVNISSNGQNILNDAANEPSIAVNPLNPDEMIIGWRQFGDVSSSFREAGYAYTTDGGNSWTFPGVIEAGIFRSDPVLGSDANGTFYYNSLAVDFGADPLRLFTDVFRSSTIGIWDTGTYAIGGDKQWMAIDQDPGEGEDPNVYAHWNSFFSDCEGNFTRSTDGGDSYEECTVASTTPLFWGTMDTGPDGALYTTGGNENGEVAVYKFTNARDKTQAAEWDQSSIVDLLGFPTGNIEESPNPDGLLGQVEIAVDRSGGETNGYVYVLCTVIRVMGESADLDVMFARSTDGGVSWDPPLRLNDDVGTNIQWFGTLSVAPNGRIDVVWLDTRDDAGTFLSSLYYTHSTDGGVNWNGNRRLTGEFDPHEGWPIQRKMGDYFDMVSTDDGAHLAWAGTFNNEQDVFYSFIQPEVLTTSIPLRQDKLGISVFPNPFSEKFSVQTSEVGELSLFIYNSVGQLLQAEKFTGEIQLDHVHWPQGMYFLDIRKGEKRAVKRLVKN
ncbi:MAG: T9SS type A sorting domain-containing protein [Bacteroidota bacterium]